MLRLLPPPFLVLDSMGLMVIFLVGKSLLLLSEISPFIGIICGWNVVGRRSTLWQISRGKQELGITQLSGRLGVVRQILLVVVLLHYYSNQAIPMVRVCCVVCCLHHS